MTRNKGNREKEKVYDGEDLFRTFCGWGAAASNPRLMRYAQDKYGQSSQMGPLYSMWKWAFRNPEAAYPLYKDMHYEKYPDEPQPTWDDFLKMLLDWGARNQNIGGSKDSVRRFCAKYGFDVPLEVSPNDVIQITKPSNLFYQRLFVVEKIQSIDDDTFVEAFAYNPDGTFTNHLFKPNDFGVVGRVIV